MLDRFFELTITSDPRFRDLGPDGSEAVRQIAAKDPGFARIQKDCESDVSRAKFTCAMAAKSSAAWQSCLK
jgi:hypothetical protein